MQSIIGAVQLRRCRWWTFAFNLTDHLVWLINICKYDSLNRFFIREICLNSNSNNNSHGDDDDDRKVGDDDSSNKMHVFHAFHLFARAALCDTAHALLYLHLLRIRFYVTTDMQAHTQTNANTKTVLRPK